MIDFMRYKLLYFALSALVIIPGVISLAKFGLKPSIDFIGGTLWEIKFEEFILEKGQNDQNLPQILKESLSELEEEKVQGFEIISVEESGFDTFLLKTKPTSEGVKNQIKDFWSEKFGPVSEVRFEMVGPKLGRELLVKTIMAVVLAAFLILFYVAWRFKERMYGVCAILAMFHDTLILLGIFSLLGHFLNIEVDTLYVTAVLTILSFSVHDTIVVYDRIRESLKKNPGADFTSLVNKAVNETLTRSLNNSLTIIFMLLALILLGGVTIRWFIVALLIGTIAGTYSSTFTAAPLLVVWHNFTKRKSSSLRYNK